MQDMAGSEVGGGQELQFQFRQLFDNGQSSRVDSTDD